PLRPFSLTLCLDPERSDERRNHDEGNPSSHVPSPLNLPRAAETRRRGVHSEIVFTQALRSERENIDLSVPPRLRVKKLFRADVVRRQCSLIPDEQPPTGDHGMCPAGQPLVFDTEPALLVIPGRCRLDEPHYIVFTQDVEIAVRVRDRALADTAVAPHPLA